MFAKLLKHEWRATRGIIGLLCIIILISGLTIGGTVRYLSSVDSANEAVVIAENAASVEPMSEIAELICVLLLMAGFIAIAVCGAGSVFFVIYRFYKSRFTDEGYLTFTLPVNHHQLLLSSYLNSVICVAIVVLTALAAILLAVLLMCPETIIWSDVVRSISEVWESILAEGYGDEIALGITSGFVSALSEFVVLMLAVTIGALIAKKHKIIAAVAVYYGISMVQSFVYTVTTVTATISENVTWFLGAPALIGLVIAVSGYFLMHYLISRKLNLA